MNSYLIQWPLQRRKYYRIIDSIFFSPKLCIDKYIAIVPITTVSETLHLIFAAIFCINIMHYIYISLFNNQLIAYLTLSNI